MGAQTGFRRGIWLASLVGMIALAGAAPEAATFKLTSPAVGATGALPKEFTCDGERVSPPLAWTAAPEGTKSFAITMHHYPQFGSGPEDRHVYIVLYNLPPTTTALDKGSKNVGTWGVNTVNDEHEYAPPCSKGPGKKVYTLTVYALSDTVTLAGRGTMDDLEAALKGKVLASAKLDVWYDRSTSPDRGGPEQGGPQGNTPGAGNSPGSGNAPGAPRLPREVERALQGLTLTPDQQTKVTSAVTDFQDEQRKLREKLLATLKSILTDEQYKQVELAFRTPPPPPPNENAPRR